MNKKITIIIVLVVVALAAIGGLIYSKGSLQNTLSIVGINSGATTTIPRYDPDSDYSRNELKTKAADPSLQEDNTKVVTIAMEGCSWKRVKFPINGLSFEVQSCPDPKTPTFVEKDNAIYQVTPAQKATPQSGKKVFQIFTKKDTDVMEDVLADVVLSKLSASDMKSCRIKSPSSTVFLDDVTKFTFSIVPTGDAWVKFAAAIRKNASATACGPYGFSAGASYFEYHPKESKTKFVYVHNVEEPAYFNEQSIVFE